MRKLMNRIDRFCYAHPRFGIPRLMLWIVLANAAVWLLMMMDTTGLAFSRLCFDAHAILHGQVWRAVTFLFVSNSSSILFFAVEMYFYYWIGSALEHQWGTGRFTIYYLIGWALTIIVGLVTGAGGGVTATYLNLSLFFAFATLYSDLQVLLFFVLPIKVKWLAYLDAALFAYAVFTSGWPLLLLPIVAVVNYLIFCGDWLFDYFRPAHVQQRKKTVDFKREAARIKRDQERKPFRHRCEVCGRTDADFPNLEFRYCSRCAGYHCYCADHITNHVHITDQ